MNIDRFPKPGQNNFWFKYSESEAVLVFLHGMLSDSRSCWLFNDKKSIEKNSYWPELVESDPRYEDISIYLAGYYTAPDSGPYEIRNCADEVFSALNRRDIDGRVSVMEKQKVIFVCHSMGGIVARYLLEANQHEFREKKVGVVLVASPSYGSKFATSLDALIAFFNNQQGVQLKWGAWNLKDLDDRFRELKEKKRIPHLFGIELYENHFIIHSRWFPIFRRNLVVTKESAGRYFGAAKQIPRTDHFNICKPTDKTDLIHQYLFDFLKENDLLPGRTNAFSSLPMVQETNFKNSTLPDDVLISQVVDKAPVLTKQAVSFAEELPDPLPNIVDRHPVGPVGIHSDSPSQEHSPLKAIDTPSAAVGEHQRADLPEFQRLFEFARSYTGLDLSSKAAATWTENFLSRHALSDFTQFKEIFEYASSYSGINLGSKLVAADWSEKWLTDYHAYSFAEFKKWFEFASSYSGMNLGNKAEAAGWALKKLQQPGIDSR